MKNKNKKNLKYYKECMESGELGERVFFGGRVPIEGLCSAEAAGKISMKKFKMMMPTLGDIEQLQRERREIAFWGSGFPTARANIFTPLRQTIVLFMAVMNKEL